jgi:hypothetical protein
MVKQHEIGAMLAYISELDPFIQPNEITIKAWGDVLADDMDARWAKQFIVRHYGKGETTRMTPGILNDAWHWSRQRLSKQGCHVCGMVDHIGEGEISPPTPQYLAARAALGHDISGALSEIEAAAKKASA